MGPPAIWLAVVKIPPQGYPSTWPCQERLTQDSVPASVFAEAAASDAPSLTCLRWLILQKPLSLLLTMQAVCPQHGLVLNCKVYASTCVLHWLPRTAVIKYYNLVAESSRHLFSAILQARAHSHGVEIFYERYWLKKCIDCVQWLMPIIPALWEVEVGRSQGQEFETSLANMQLPDSPPSVHSALIVVIHAAVAEIFTVDPHTIALSSVGCNYTYVVVISARLVLAGVHGYGMYLARSLQAELDMES
ncbi:Regulator of G-protein signaling 3 [Plecturocebus cupreus]